MVRRCSLLEQVLSIDRLSKVVYEGGFSIPYPLHFLSALAFERPAEMLLVLC